MGMGQMGMNADDFWGMTPGEFQNKVAGFYDHQMYHQRQEWERVRWSTCVLFNIQVDPKNRIEPQKLIKFEWEKSDKLVEVIGQQELQKLLEFYGDKPKR
jgi:hypothetical protein